MDWDLFLSYSHVDDGSPKDWVKKLHEELVARMRVLEPRLAPQTWNDFTQLRGDENIYPTIKAAVQSTRVLICVVSPNYVDPASVYCKEELDIFLGSPRLGEPKIVKVVKLPVDDLWLWDPLGNMEGFKLHDDALPPLELAPENRERVVNELAWRLSQLIKLARNGPKGRVCLLANPDRRPALERTRNEMLLKEYDVLPGDLPGSVAPSESEVKDSLDRADLTVLIFGTTYSADVELAFRYLREKLKESKLPRCVLSLPREEISDPRQRALLADVRVTPVGFDPIDEPPIPDLWRAVLPRLKNIENSRRKPTVYLRYPRQRRPDVNAVRLKIPNSEFDILDPFEEGGFAADVQTAAFERAHGILVYTAEKAHELLLRIGKELQRARKKVIGIYPANPGVELESRVLDELRFPILLPDDLDGATPLGRSVAHLDPEQRWSFPSFLQRVRENAVSR